MVRKTNNRVQEQRKVSDRSKQMYEKFKLSVTKSW